ncbi:MAG: transaldolase [Nocardioidaceae bacterium]|nr:transaldolase [Nocardioidaceae bacterium]MDQ3325220.1 transaldolase [Actinomycetota bacterium]
MTDTRLQALADQGVALWLDDISRERLTSGDLAELRDRGVVGVTSNPSIFAAALKNAEDYADQVRDLSARGVSLEEAVRMITAYDVRWACDVFAPTFEQTGGRDGRVSLEVDPRLAHQTLPTTAEARALWWLVDRPNLLIKIPATEAGLQAITDTIAEGISVNVTLIFGLDRYDAVMDAYLTGLEHAQNNGHDLSTIYSVASFFVSRVDSEVDKRLAEIGSAEADSLRSKAALANARLAYQRYEAVIGSQRWQSLASAGANVQRPLWASTSVKDESLPDTMYVDNLVARDTVNTMPEPTLEATADHGDASADTVTGAYDEARDVLDQLEKLGIGYDDVIAVLEREGVDKFEKSWAELLDTVRTALDNGSAGGAEGGDQ